MTMISTVKKRKGHKHQTGFDSKIACTYCTLLTDLLQSEPSRDRCYAGISLNHCNDKTIHVSCKKCNACEFRAFQRERTHISSSLVAKPYHSHVLQVIQINLQANQQKEFIWLWQTAAVNDSS